jgi:zinc transport system substrate-binding protein
VTAVLNASACSDSEPTRGTGQPLEVLAAFYPYQFVAERVAGSDARVQTLTEPGTEPHDLGLSPQQVVALGEANLVLYSRGFQPAVDEAVEQSSGKAASTSRRCRSCGRATRRARSTPRSPDSTRTSG